MPKVRNRAGVGDKWASNTSGATGAYQQGVQNPRNSWSAAAQGAKEAYKAGVTEAASKGRYEKGVQAAGDAGWQNGALNVGVGRFAGGVQAGQGKYTAKVEKYLGVIESTALPPRQSKGSPGNFQRVQIMADALRKAKAA